ncbi:DUF4817 domain-containing protein [Trichonephila clavipes]|nr:DUF4817 domain-containing protein [Trichonephila clavipes]
MLWSKYQRAFAVRAYFSYICLVIAEQRGFLRHFDIPLRGRVPDRKCVLMRVDTFRATENVFKERKGTPKTIRTPENVERVCVSVQTDM